MGFSVRRFMSPALGLCLIVGCSGDSLDGDDGVSGSDGADAPRTIIIEQEVLGPNEVLRVGHSLAEYDAKVEFLHGGRVYEAAELPLVYNAVSSTDAPHVVLGDTNAEQSYPRNGNVAFEPHVGGYLAVWLRDVDGDAELVMETIDALGYVQSFEVLVSNSAELNLNDSYAPSAFTTSDGVLVITVEGFNSGYILTFLGGQLSEYLDVGTLGEFAEQGDGWKIRRFDSNQNYAALTGENELVMCMVTPMPDADSNAVPSVSLRGFSIGADGSITPSNGVVINDRTVAGSQAERCSVAARPSGVAAIFERRGDSFDEIWAGMYDLNLEVEMEQVVADEEFRKRTISCNERDVCLVAFEQAGPDLYVYSAIKADGVSGTSLLAGNELDELTSTALTDGRFMITSTQDDSEAASIWVFEADGSILQEPQQLALFRAVDDDNENTLVPAADGSARFFYDTYETSTVSNYVSAAVSQNRLDQKRVSQGFEVKNSSFHTVEVMVTLSGRP